jgi:hypothetical protein
VPVCYKSFGSTRRGSDNNDYVNSDRERQLTQWGLTGTVDRCNLPVKEVIRLTDEEIETLREVARVWTKCEKYFAMLDKAGLLELSLQLGKKSMSMPGRVEVIQERLEVEGG